MEIGIFSQWDRKESRIYSDSEENSYRGKTWFLTTELWALPKDYL